jgi:hypothetical protein
MRRLGVLVVFATACNRLIGVHDFAPGDGGGVDVLPDADPGPCVADAITCTAGGTAVQQCASDGSGNTVTEGCARNCVDTGGAHCEYLQPFWLPDVCDARASNDLTFSSNATIDTDAAPCADTTSPVCVVRGDRIEIKTGVILTLRGDRPIAFVADRELLLRGALDAAAIGADIPGPGAITEVPASSSAGTLDAGGGGAGFAMAGAPGGTFNMATSTGGPIVDPMSRGTFAGGYSASRTTLVEVPSGGAGGGGVLLVACRGSLTLATGSSINVGGGGGEGQHDSPGGALEPTEGGGGGGAGGYVVLQALTTIQVDGGIFANGGGGGAGNTSTNEFVGKIGEDGQAFVGAATGGVGTGNGGNGGNGGFFNTPPTAGLPGGSGCIGGNQPCGVGGGGGAMGWLDSFAPDITKITISPSKVSAQRREMPTTTR